MIDGYRPISILALVISDRRFSIIVAQSTLFAVVLIGCSVVLFEVFMHGRSIGKRQLNQMHVS